jgi:diguanylate cyclase (GGDEF)-like protein
MPTDTQKTQASPGPVATGPQTACVVVIHGEGLGKRVDIGEHEVLIGRSHNADLQIAHPSVSRRHCALQSRNGICSLRDLGATNQTQLNGRPIESAELSDGNHITVGESILKFISHTSVEARYHEEVHQLASCDALTGLFNRRYFVDTLDREIARALQDGRPLALAILDVDLFKQINDTHGHLTGDLVLKQVSAIIKRNVDGECIAARIGGEEFAMLLPALPAADAHSLAETIRSEIARTPFRAGDAVHGVTISIGTALLAPGRDTRSTLLQAADEALYRAKASGRNRVCSADG